jgi:hypothetical protein
VTGTRARPGDDELRERHVQIAQAQDDDSDATNSAPVCAHLLPLTSTQHHAECTLYPDDLKTHIDGTAMSDGGKSRSSSSCKLPTAQSRTFERTAPHRTVQQLTQRRSSLFCGTELGSPLRGAPPAGGPAQNTGAAIALQHTRRDHTIHCQRTQSHTAILARHTSQHAAHGMRVSHLLFRAQRPAT